MGKRKKPRAKTTTAATTAITKVPQPHGGALNSGGTPGNNGGRPPEAWKQLCRDLSSRKEMADVAAKVLQDDAHPAWLGAWKFLAEQGYGRATQAVDVTSGGAPVKFTLDLGTTLRDDDES